MHAWSKLPDNERLYVLKRKSENMNLKFKSTDADLKFNIQSQIRILNQNILYITRQVDLCVKWLKQMNTDTNLQQQVDKYFEEDTEHIPEVNLGENVGHSEDSN